MAIYDINGTELADAYAIDGTELSDAYDIDGNAIFHNAPAEIKVMTYNVGQWYCGNGSVVPSSLDADYYALQNGMIASADADILLIEEYRDQFSEAGRTALSMLEQYYPYIHTENGSSGYFGRAICSKYPISNYETHSFSVGANRYYDSCDVTISGRSVKLVIVHLITSPETTRWTQCQELVTYLNTLNTFIAGGDYNTAISPDYDTDNTESEWYIKYIKSFTDEGYNTANCGDFGFLTTCIDSSNIRWDIDNIITSSDITITSASVDTTKETDDISGTIDHMPLIAELEIN